MITGFANVGLRPLKFAFIVNPYDSESILQAIQLNTFLWGGTFNPIIPAFRRLPKSWKDSSSLTSKNIVQGYIEAFDPDYCVLAGDGVPTGQSYRRPVLRASQILEQLEEDWTPRYGIGLFEICAHLAESEFKFVRKEPVNIYSANHEQRHKLFLAALFGDLPESVQKVFLETYEETLEIKQIDCSLSNYGEVLREYRPFFVRQLMGLYRAEVRRAQLVLNACLFYLDPENTLDVIDYWNLRALGWRIIPIAIQSIGNIDLRQHVLHFIDEQYFPHRFNPQLQHSTVFLKGRSVRDNVFRTGFESLSRDVSNVDATKPKLIRQVWYPRIWDRWERVSSAQPCSLDGGTATREFKVDEERLISIQGLDPDFLDAFDFPSANPRYANHVSLNVFGEKELYAEVIPEAGRELNHAFGGLEIRTVRFSKTGLIYLCDSLNSSIHTYLPKAQDVFSGWMKSQGWTVKISDKGRIAAQMLKQLGGKWGVGILKNEKTVPRWSLENRPYVVTSKPANGAWPGLEVFTLPA